MPLQQTKAKQFHDLHHSGKLLILPNIWEPLGAALLERIGYPAVATGSGAVAHVHGYPDGEIMPLADAMKAFEAIVKSVNLPVTIDFEAGYADNNQQFADNIEHLISIGVVGLNLEDSSPKTKQLIPIDEQCEKIEIICDISDRRGVPLFINARTDTYIHSLSDDPDYMLAETVKRGLAYKKTGAHCIYPITLKRKDHIEHLLEKLQMPLNILTLSGIPDLKTLQKMGVARASLGSSFLKVALRAMKSTAEQLLALDGLDAVTQNEITSPYLKSLVNNPQ